MIKCVIIWHILEKSRQHCEIKLLLELFPDAKFVLIQQNPYDLYYSMLKFIRIIILLNCVQNPFPFDAVEDSMMDLYLKIFRKYLQERSLITEGNLIEVKYEDFIRELIKIIQRIYSELNLDGITVSKAAFETYLKNQESFNRESYTVSDEVREKVDRRWGFVKEGFDYS